MFTELASITSIATQHELLPVSRARTAGECAICIGYKNSVSIIPRIRSHFRRRSGLFAPVPSKGC
jgi:hypothetical protein